MELTIFNNQEFGSVRATNINGEPWLSGRDVANALGYKNTKDALLAHVDELDRRVIQRSEIATLENHLPKEVFPVNFVSADIPNRGATFINESGIYSLIFGSKLPRAKEFKHWVTSEVLPAIRKHGAYATETTIDNILNDPDFGIRLLSDLKAERQKVAVLKARNEEMRPKEIFADAVSASHTSILIGDLAKLIKQNGYDIGQKRLFQWLRDNDYLIKNGSSKNMPTQKAMDLGLFEVKERTINNPDGSIRVTKTTKVTGKGQVYFINKFIQKE